MKKEVEIIDSEGNVQTCSVLQGCFLKGKSATLGLALLYSIRKKWELFVMDAEFIKAILDDINELNNVILLERDRVAKLESENKILYQQLNNKECEHPYAFLVGEEQGSPKCNKCGKDL